MLALISLALLIVNARKKHPPEDLFVNRVAAAAADTVQEKADNTENREETEHE